MRQSKACAALVAALALTAIGNLSAVERWADESLPVTDGLELWLDASRQNAARRSLGKPALRNEQKLEVCNDASGRGSHLVARDQPSRPTIVLLEGHRAVRFDGSQQYLSLSPFRSPVKDLTVFLVAVPFSNPGNFRGFMAFNQTGHNDYSSGLTIDQGPGATARLQSVNVEGAGFGGAKNVLRQDYEFGTVQRLCVASTIAAGGTKLYVNNRLEGQRDRGQSMIHMDQFTLGARYYTNGRLPQVRGFFEGDILEVLVYGRLLSDAERSEVDKYLAAKHGSLRQIVIPRRSTTGRPLATVPKPPPVQVFVPGFTVKRLPVDLTNINNIQYRADGKLVALAYDGNIYLLSDSDGDGLEDRVELFWNNQGRLRAPIGMALTPPGYSHGSGAFVASKGKCSLLVDTTGKDTADKEIVIATGWPEIPHGVDALGVAYDVTDGSVYFGLGTADYTNPYRLRDGKVHYRLDNERGTILRVAPDFRHREIVCTGIRFPVGIHFNRDGDLFCTDQEGATWIPNGNPLDELLHVQKGRHYGFPPRHPRHLPGVIDEPSTFDYGPQHQSTCGFNFNEPVNSGPVFGPSWWRGDALVAGYSRGKLYRTKLVKTEAGYVAHNQLLASLNMLAVDASISPQGDLVVAVHSGGPDWGSGPAGKGTLYKLSYTGKDLAQPVLVWPQGPCEVCVGFDRPIAPELLRNLTGRIAIEYGRFVSAGDRFELHRPGYQAVQDQLNAPRFELAVLSVQLTSDRRTLILATAPHPEALEYALTLPGLGRPMNSETKSGELPQVPETDLAYDLTGVDVSWQANGPSARWTGWLPHFDLTVARALTAASSVHDDLWTRIQQPGKLILRSQVNLVDMLRPAVQPGSKIDYEWPVEEVTLTFQSHSGLEVRTPAGTAAVTTDMEGRRTAVVTVKPAVGSSLPIDVALTKGPRAADLIVTYHTNEDSRPRPLPLHRVFLPWAKMKREEAPAITNRDVAELNGGSWARGRQVFFSEPAGCFKCHAFNGHGGAIGPDLSNLPQRDYHSVLRDIAEPSFAINPDYVTQVVALQDGRVLTGTIRTEGDELIIGDAQGNVTKVLREQVEATHTAPTSIMPEGIPKLLGPARMKDLLTFLLSEPPHLTDYGKGTPPPPRAMDEVKGVLAGAPDPPLKTRPIHVVLVAGKKDHGPGEHDYPAWQKVWQKLLGLAPETKVTTAWEWPTADDFKAADVMVFYQQGKWMAERAKEIDAFLARGGGLVYIHYAVDGGKDAPGFAQRIGLAWRGGQSKFRHGPLDLGFETGKGYPITRNLDKVHFQDESYWQLEGDANKITLLGTGREDGKRQPLFWTLEPSKGRVFVSIPGHFSWTFDDPLFRVLLLRGIAWVAREPVDRFNELVTAGARIK
jgi:putative heme-binding domain-containing protein